MSLKVFGGVHWLYLAITLTLSAVGLFCAKKFAKSEKSQKIVLKCIAGMLLIWILINRLSQVFRYSEVRWNQIIPDSFCGMTSLVLSLSVLLGKKDNPVLHFTWFLAIVGDVITLAYPTFLDQGSSVFYLPTISGLLHHSLSLVMVVSLLLFNQIHITYKKWYCSLFGFTAYFTVGAFQMSVFGFGDAFHIVEPMLSGTPLTAWVIAPIYIVGYGSVLLAIELIRRHKTKKQQNSIETT
ncbi:MAG: YwaF family protein [Clostridia bacterium]|nr:YwaF family protein [Clostridia bacterium]